MNSNMPAMPTPVMDNGSTPHGTEPTYGLTKREMIAKDMDVSGSEFRNMEALEAFIGCKVDQSSIISMVESQAKANAKLKVIFADALLAELDKSKGDAK